MNTLLIGIILIYHVIFAVIDCKDIRKYKDMLITEKVRVNYYKEIVLASWIPVCIILMFIIFTTLSYSEIGLRNIQFSNIIWLNVVTVIVHGVLILVLLIQSVQCITNKEYQMQVQKSFNKENNKAYDSMLHVLIPRTKREKKWWFLVSVSAGVCEEIVWRGTLMFLLQQIFPSIGFVSASIISCILFGFMHSYQGIYGVIKTGLVSISFILLLFVTGSIIPGIFVHFLLDYSSAFLISDTPPVLS